MLVDFSVVLVELFCSIGVVGLFEVAHQFEEWLRLDERTGFAVIVEMIPLFEVEVGICWLIPLHQMEKLYVR